MTRSQPLEVSDPQVEFEKLVQHAKKVVVAERRASIGLLKRGLGTTWSIAKEVINRLEKDGLIGPDRPKTSREVLVFPPGKKGSKPEQLVAQAKELILQHQNASYEFLQRELSVSSLTAKRILQLLEAQKVVGPGIRGQRRKILIANPTGTPAPVMPSADPVPRASCFTVRQQIRVLQDFIKFFGGESVRGELIRSVITDLESLQNLKKTLRRLGQEQPGQSGYPCIMSA